MAAKTPLLLVTERFGDKSKLVEAVEKLARDELWVARAQEGKGLKHVSNAKLLRLFDTFTQVKEKFGTRDKLIDAILEIEKRSKDAGLRQRLSGWAVPRLFDAYRSASKRAARRPSPPPPAEKPAAKRAKAKAQPAKKRSKKES